MDKKSIESALRTITAEDHERYRTVTVSAMTHDGTIKSFHAGADGDVLLIAEILGEGAKLRLMGILKPAAGPKPPTTHDTPATTPPNDQGDDPPPHVGGPVIPPGSWKEEQ